jgi:hypothetical protein
MSSWTHTARVALLRHETIILAGLKSSKFLFGETFFTFFRSSEFLRSTLLIEEFQIFVVADLIIRTYSNHSNFSAAPCSQKQIACPNWSRHPY